MNTPRHDPQRVLANRLRNRQRHLKKWARRRGITCYRIYERDVPDYPVIVDWYDGEAVVWIYDRTKDETIDDAESFRVDVIEQVEDGIDLEAEQLFVKERRRQRGLDQYERIGAHGGSRIVDEHGLRFEVNLSDYLDTGLFLDHRSTRQLVQSMAAGTSFLNLFAYTGSFSCAARRGGAVLTETVDLSRTYGDWTLRNFEHNGFDVHDARHKVVQADVLQYLDVMAEDGRAFNLVVCDPPTFSNSKRMAVDSFSMQRDYAALLAQLARVVAPGGTLFLSTNARKFRLDEDAVPAEISVREISEQTVPEDFRNRRIHRCWKMERRLL